MTGVEFRVHDAIAGSSGAELSPAFVSMLPEVLKTVLERADETRRDIANAHVEMLRPFLAKHGVAYERQKLSERLRAGELALTYTSAWLADVLAAEPADVRARLAAGDAAAHTRLVADGLLHLLKLPVRLDAPAARLPETLAMDGRRLAGARDEVDRLALVAVYATLLRQFLAQQRISAAAEPLADMERRLYTILRQDDGVKLPHLVDEVRSGLGE
jgi:hypothetical protein